MDFGDVINSRKSVFERPKRVRDILGNKEVIEVEDYGDIVPAMESRGEGQAVLIKRGVNIIPKDEFGDDLFYSHKNFSKRGPVVVLKTYRDAKSQEIKWTPIKARIEASLREENLEAVEKGQRFVAWAWKDPEGSVHVVHPSRVIEGRRLEMYGHLVGDIRNRVTYKKRYHSEDSDLLRVGMDVPSRSDGNKSVVVLEHLTRLNDPRRFSEWMRFSTRHSCGSKEGDFSFRFDKSTDYCAHDVAAHVAYSRAVAKKSGRIVLQPFAMPTEAMVRLFVTAMYHTMIEDSNGRGGFPKRSLSFPEFDALAFDAHFRYGNKDTFWVPSPTKQYQSGKGRRTMRDYDWSIDGSGLPFAKS